MPAALMMPGALRELVEATTCVAPSSAPPRRRRAFIAILVAVGAALSVGALAIVLYRSSAPRLPPLEGMAWIDVGTITVGRDTADLDRECAAIGPGCDRELMQREAPSARVTVAPFQLDVYEVTNDELALTLDSIRNTLFVAEDADHHYPRYVRWNKNLGHDGEVLVDLEPVRGGIEYTADHRFHVRPGFERLPAVQVTWYGASLYCATRGKSLPTEDEWEAAARGREDRPFPWGRAPIRCGEVGVPRDGLVSMDASCPAEVALAPVGQAAQDVTPDGIHDLGGNAAEWVSAVFVAGNRQAHAGAGGGDLPKVIRGGSILESLLVRTSGRNRHIANGSGYNVGFRCASH
jgi:formylglycine-generating enzyme required for sulfatase activity